MDDQQSMCIYPNLPTFYAIKILLIIMQHISNIQGSGTERLLWWGYLRNVVQKVQPRQISGSYYGDKLHGSAN